MVDKAQIEIRTHIKKALWVYIAAFALVIFSFHSEAQESAAAAPEKQATAKEKTTQKEKKVATPEKKKSSKKTAECLPIKKGAKVIAEFDTSMGKFKVKLFPDKAPKTVENFVCLAEGTKEWKDPKTGAKKKEPFYDGLTFHRTIPDFMIQGGCPKGDGTGDPGYKFADEKNDLTHKGPGIMSMANAGPDTNGSQFFITVAKTDWLDGKHTIFGEVSEGLDVVMNISKVKTNSPRENRPVEEVKIKTVKIIRQ